MLNTKTIQATIVKFRKFSYILPRHVASHSLTLLKWGIAGYLIRVALMPLIPNIDLITFAWAAFIMKERHQLVLTPHPEPIIYLLAFLYTLFDPFLSKGVFDDVLKNTTYTPSYLSIPFRLSEHGIFTYFFVSKMSYLTFDFILGLMLLHIIKDEKKALLAFKLWMVNPVSIYVSYAIGQYDIIPVFFMMLSLYFLQNQKMKSTMLSLGVACAFKTFALLFVLPITLFYTKKFRGLEAKAKRFFLLLAVSLLPIVLSKIAVYFTPIYYWPVNVASLEPLSDITGFFGNSLLWAGKVGPPSLMGLFSFGLDYSISFKTFDLFYDVIYVFPLLYSLFLLALIYRKNVSFEALWKAILVFLLLYYASSLFHMQWFLWAQPLLIFLIIGDRPRFLKTYIALILLFFVYILYWSPEAVALINKTGLPSVQIINIFRSMFSGVCIFTAALILFPSIVAKIVGIVRGSE